VASCACGARGSGCLLLPVTVFFMRPFGSLFNIRLKKLHKYLDVDVVVIASECVGNLTGRLSGHIRNHRS
jgi:hypothetical protein